MQNKVKKNRKYHNLAKVTNPMTETSFYVNVEVGFCGNIPILKYWDDTNNKMTTVGTVDLSTYTAKAFNLKEGQEALHATREELVKEFNSLIGIVPIKEDKWEMRKYAIAKFFWR